MSSKPAKRNAFTLLEILLVIMVIGIAAAAFLPVALNTAENARTRSAMREIIALNRYARSRAILDRKPMAVVYQTGNDRLQLLSLPVQRDMEAETLFNSAMPDTESETGVTLVRNRPLPKFVSIRSVEGAEQEADGYFVIYHENGSCVSHVVEVAAPNGDLERIRINGMTGEIELE
jgi:prepilin-type N-terminal cleavage/methylation domain-containing protein